MGRERFAINVNINIFNRSGKAGLVLFVWKVHVVDRVITSRKK
jgi:hypothetical protein